MSKVRTSETANIGIITDDSRHNVKTEQGGYSMVTVYWLDGMGTGLYWTDELEII